MTRTLCLATAIILGGGACTFEGHADPLGGSVKLTGQIVDWKTRAPIVDGDASIEIDTGNDRPANVTVTGTNFTVDNVPENSIVDLIAAIPPTHRATRSAILFLVDDFDASPLVVDEVTLHDLAVAAGASQSPSTGVIFARLTTSAQPRLGVQASELALSMGGTAPPGVKGPLFLDANLAVSSGDASIAEGWVVYFDVPAGLPLLTSAPSTTFNFTKEVPVAAGVVTLAEVDVVEGMSAPLPANVSFANQIIPIFRALNKGGRGCVACHAKQEEGSALGGLTLGDGGENDDNEGQSTKVWDELVTERPGIRVNKTPGMETTSLVLVRPSREVPPDGHNVIFTGSDDPAYRLILAWILEGAKNN